jgi:predicted  nucleic acid-binding Zn-ribbon protein
MSATNSDASRRAGCLFLAAVFFLLLCTAAQARNDDVRQWKKIEDPHFGEVLYYFYQQKYFSALTHVMSAQQLQRTSHNSDEAELLRGGLFLSYGLHTEAGRIFQRLIDQGVSPQVRDRAWFFIAKIRYQRGYTGEAEEALTNVRDTLPSELEEERKVLLAYLLIGRKKYPEAIELLKDVKTDSEWGAYGLYNVGVALIKYGQTADDLAGNKEEGVNLLTKVGYMPAASEEMRSLRDKANLALGYYFLQEGAPSRSKAYLNEVRINGPLSNKALLGVGWGYSSEGRHELSLPPWVELQQRDVMDSAVQESLLAVPYAYGQLGAYKQALQHYQSAIATYEQELARLDGAILSIRAGKLSANILRQDPDDEMGWFWQMRKLPDAPESRYLIQLMSSNEFQESFKNYRDLRFLQSNLSAWSRDIDVYSDMLATRRLAYARHLPGVQEALRRTDLSAQIEARDRYAREIAGIETMQDTLALASNEQSQLLMRLARVESRLAALAGSEDTSVQEDKYRLYSGLLRWNIASDYMPHLWEAQKALRQLDVEIKKVRERKASLERAQSRAGKTFEGYDARIDTLRGRIVSLLSQVAEQAGKQERYLENMAVAELERHKQRLSTYLLQARFAVAQIYDQAARARSAEQQGTAR